MNSKDSLNTENWKNAGILKTELANQKRITITIEGAHTDETDIDKSDSNETLSQQQISFEEYDQKTNVVLTTKPTMKITGEESKNIHPIAGSSNTQKGFLVENEKSIRRSEENVLNEMSTSGFIDENNFKSIAKEHAVNDHIDKQSENCAETSLSKPLQTGVEVYSKRIRDGLKKDIRPTVPCEYTLHTVYIHAATSPNPSIMFRPPLSVRFWKIVSDFTAAFCFCIQVNRDCIFCFAFVVAFVVSASFLTSFFYRSFNIGPEISHQNIDPAKLENVGSSNVVVPGKLQYSNMYT